MSSSGAEPYCITRAARSASATASAGFRTLSGPVASAQARLLTETASSGRIATAAR